MSEKQPLSHREAIISVKQLAQALINKYWDSDDSIHILIRDVAQEFYDIADQAVEATPIHYPEINYNHLAQVMLERARWEQDKLNAEAAGKVVPQEKENEP